MTPVWPQSPLVDLADIRVSNVDKKVHPAETLVRLCNYMDVYLNTYVTRDIDFMDGSASRSELNRFTLQRGDVVITKDSETPDDIGIPAVIADDIERLVCGYHLALIRPKFGNLDSVFLAKQLSTHRVARYFARQATGSTRYGLPTSAIENVTIPTPPRPEQEKIAEILSTVDAAIERIELVIAKQQRIRNGLMRDLLTRGLDEHNRLRSEETHRFKNTSLGSIPVEWDASRLERVGRWLSGGTPSKANPSYWGDEIPWVCPKDMKSFDLSTTIDRLTPAGARHGTRMVPANTVFIVVRGMILAHTFPVSICSVPVAFNQDVKAIVPAPHMEARFLAYWLVCNAPNLLKLTTTATHGTKRFDMKELLGVSIAVPGRDEQSRIVQRLDTISTEISLSKKTAGKLRLLNSALMQELLTGNKRVTALLDPEPKDEKLYAVA